MEQLISYGAKVTVDNLILQHILKLIDSANIRNEKMAEIKLRKCGHCDKQYVLFISPDQQASGLEGECFICAEPEDADLLVYRFKDNAGSDTMIICLESEAEALCS